MLLLLLHVTLFVCLSSGWWFLWALLSVYLFIYAKVLLFIHINISIIVLLNEIWLYCAQKMIRNWYDLPYIYICTCLIILPDQELTFGRKLCTLSLIVHVHWVVLFDPFHLLSVVSWSSLGYWGGTFSMWLRGWKTQKTCTWGRAIMF